MDKNLARRNMRLGIALFIILLSMFAATFIWAQIYLNAVS